MCDGPSSWYICRAFRAGLLEKGILELGLRLEIASQEPLVAQTNVLWKIRSSELEPTFLHNNGWELSTSNLQFAIVFSIFLLWSWLSVAIYHQDWCFLFFNCREVFLCIHVSTKTRNKIDSSRFFLFLACFTYLHHLSGCSLKWQMQTWRDRHVQISALRQGTQNKPRQESGKVHGTQGWSSWRGEPEC